MCSSDLAAIAMYLNLSCIPEAQAIIGSSVAIHFFYNSNPGDGALARQPSPRGNSPQMATTIETERRTSIPDPRRA